jgi:hypothetical protein
VAGLEGNIFESSLETGGAVGTVLTCDVCTITNNVFDGALASSMGIYELTQPLDLTFAYNLLVSDTRVSGDVSMVFVAATHGTIRWERNTLSRVSAYLGAIWSRGSISCRGNLFHRSPVFVDTGGVAEVMCNNSWPDTIRTSPARGTYVREANISQDPMFCDERGGDYHIAEGSPCAPGNSPSTCGLIGLYGVGCERSGTQAMTWGQIKSRFHGR